MSKALIESYTFGLSHISPFSPAGDLFYGIPKRQREMIELTKSQIENQKTAAREIATSNFQSADLICREIEYQTHALESAIGQLSGDITSALYDIGERICGDLSEIRWELEQLRSVSDQILEVLRRPRSTEAQELIRQGIRHLVNNEISEAEDRFRKALERDSTDYQVLMNLSYISLHKNQGDEAIMFTNKALTLPDNLDRQAKSDALWSLSRIYYTLAQFDQAFSLAQKAIEIVATPKRRYQAGIYRVLSGNKTEGIALIHQAILQDSSLFALAATDPDLKTAMPDILALLDQLSRNIRKKTDQRWQSLTSELKTLPASKSSDYANLLLSSVLEICGKMQFKLDLPSYSSDVINLNVITSLQETLPDLKKLEPLYLKLNNLSVKKNDISQDLDSARTDYSGKLEIWSKTGGFWASLTSRKRSLEKSMRTSHASVTSLETELFKTFDEFNGITSDIQTLRDRIKGKLSSLTNQFGKALNLKIWADVILVAPGIKKGQVTDVLIHMTGLRLKQVDALVDNAPSPVRSRLTKEEATFMKTQLEELGATVEIT